MAENLYTMTVLHGDNTTNLSSLDLAEKPKKSVAGEQTGPQVDSGDSSVVKRIVGGGGIISSASAEPVGFSPPPPGTYETYDLISRYPTVAMVMQAALGPIIANEGGFQKKEDDVPDEYLELIQECFDTTWPDIVRDGMRAIPNGYAPFEAIFEFTDGRIMLNPDQPLKPLDPRFCQFIQDKKNGAILGIKNEVPGYDPVELLGPKAFWYSNDPKYGNPFGNPRHENIRKEWSEATQIQDRLARYLKKVAAIIVQLHYPGEGESFYFGGAKYPNAWIADDILKRASRGDSLMFPNLFAAEIEKDPSKAAELAGKSSWVLSALEVGKSDHAEGFIKSLEMYDKLFVRGWLRPERSVLEAQHGSRADSQTHSDIGIIDSETISRDFARAVNRRLVDLILMLNFGPKARGTVFYVPKPISNDTAASWDKIITAGMGAQTVGPALAQVVDWIEMFEEQGIPIRAAIQEQVEKTGIDGIIAAQQKAAAALGMQTQQKPGKKPSDNDQQNMSKIVSGYAWQRRIERQRVAAFADER
jgi:hypothetical protein